MKHKNDIIAGGLNGLLNPTPTTAEQAKPEQVAEKEPKPYKTVCYSIPVEVAEKVRYIAYYDRKKLNAVVVEAFQRYFKEWTPAKEEPKTL